MRDKQVVSLSGWIMVGIVCIMLFVNLGTALTLGFIGFIKEKVITEGMRRVARRGYDGA